MMVTLHSYVLRELLKNLALSLTVLTTLLTMGGGLYNVIAFEGTSTADVARFLHLLIPTVMVFALPIAALFSVAMVYGRLAADNELLACRAAGVNVHRLFVSAIMLGIFVAVVTLLFANFVTPHVIQQIGEAARNNLRDLVARHLQEDGYFHLRNRGARFGNAPGDGGDSYTITAERVQGVTDEALEQKNFEAGPGLQYLLITNPTLLHQDGDGELVRFTAARHGLCQFDGRRNPLAITLYVHDAYDFQLGKMEVRIGQQQFGPVTPPLPSLHSLSFTDLRLLLAWQDAPWQEPELREQIDEFRTALRVQLFYDDIIDRVSANRPIELYDRHGKPFVIEAASAQFDMKEKGVMLDAVEVLAGPAPGDALPSRYEAAQTLLKAKPLPSGVALIEIHLLRTPDQDVREFLPRDGTYGDARRKPTMTLDGALLPARIAREVDAYAPSQIVDPNVPLPATELLEERRLSLYNGVQDTQREILGAIHFRLGFTSSAVVTIFMAAILGVIFRGGRALAAFALSMIPFISVGIVMVMGRKVIEDAAIPEIGLGLIWGGLGLVLLVDFVLLYTGVRR